MFLLLNLVQISNSIPVTIEVKKNLLHQNRPKLNNPTGVPNGSYALNRNRRAAKTRKRNNPIKMIPMSMLTKSLRMRMMTATEKRQNEPINDHTRKKGTKKTKLFDLFAIYSAPNAQHHFKHLTNSLDTISSSTTSRDM